ncbi:protein of unknown function [Anaerovirgula multivorans]|uniref:DUF4367 domain-containing protein n=1 Tax=Anaerovirgula multivorans TaxID=312168 RepID=A0A239KA00_9FIRM|nr:DUF4367 domain-containing protein [Anaerovirgula multivorans]SNT13954.1 protein of unknown function [Anaerovirgula multivorans]
MYEGNKGKFDILLGTVLQEEMEDMDISEEEIDQEWDKLQRKLSSDRKKKQKNLKKIAVLLLGTVISLGMLNLATTNESAAWKRGPIKHIISVFDNVISINRDSTSVEGDKFPDQYEQNIIKGTIKDARDIVNFNFRELPFEIEQVLIKVSNDNMHFLELNYLYDNKSLRWTQYVQGIEHSENINVAANSTVKEMTINDTEYTIIRIPERQTMLVWTYFGVRNRLNINEDIPNEEMIEIINAME